MSDVFFQSPILNSPYEEPQRHWELDANGQPTSIVVPRRRQSALVSPIPKAKKVRGKTVQADLLADEFGQEYNPTEVINGIRSAVASWRTLPQSQWQVTPTTARLLLHWRTHPFANQHPFFCQIEAVETVIWLTEVHSAEIFVDICMFIDQSSTQPAYAAGSLRRVLSLRPVSDAFRKSVSALLTMRSGDRSEMRQPARSIGQ